MKRIISRMDATHDQLLGMIEPISDEVFAQRPSETEWSVAEVLHHVSIVEERVLEQLQKGLSKPAPKAGVLQRFFPMWLAVGMRTIRVKAPKFVEPLNPPPRKEIIANFNRTRDALKEFAVTQGRARLKDLSMPHPFLGRLDGLRAVSFVRHHERRHYKQIREIIQKIK